MTRHFETCPHDSETQRKFTYTLRDPYQERERYLERTPGEAVPLSENKLMAYICYSRFSLLESIHSTQTHSEVVYISPQLQFFKPGFHNHSNRSLRLLKKKLFPSNFVFITSSKLYMQPWTIRGSSSRTSTFPWQATRSW